MQLLLL
jgi:hypothetical protein